MGQLIGLAILFFVVVGVVKKLALGDKSKNKIIYDKEEDIQEQLQESYREGFLDGMKQAQQQLNQKDKN